MPKKSVPETTAAFEFSFDSREIETLVIFASRHNQTLREIFGGNEEKASKDLAKLKTEFGCAINQGVSPYRLTPEANELARISSEYFAALREFRRKCASLRPEIAIGAGDSLVNCILLPALNHGALSRIPVIYSIRMGRTQDNIAFLHSAKIDFALLPEGAGVDPSWRKESVGLYEYCVCCPKKLLRGVPLTKALLPGLNFALIADHWNLDFLHRAKVAGVKLSDSVAVRCETFTQVVSLVSTEGFCGIVPVSAVSGFSKHSFEFLKPDFLEGTDRKINLVWNENRRHGKACVAQAAMPLLAALKEQLQASQQI